VVPPTDGLYALATSAASAAATAAVKAPPPVAASAVPPSFPPAHRNGHQDDDDDDVDVDGEGPIGGPGTVGGVWMPPVGGGGPWGTTATGANAKPVAVGFAAPAGGGPALLTGVAGARGGSVSGGRYPFVSSFDASRSLQAF
jgi:hypothetical protein